MECLLGVSELCVEARGIVAVVVFEVVEFFTYGVEMAFALCQKSFGEFRSVGLPLFCKCLAVRVKVEGIPEGNVEIVID